MRSTTLHQPNILSAPSPKRRIPWWAGVIFYAAVMVVGRLVSGKPDSTQSFYQKQQEQAPWAPPGWVFGPAWAIINIFVVRALWLLVNEANKDKRSRQLLWLQGVIWTIFVTFGWAYFRKRSPVLCAIWTQAGAIVALISIIKAKKKEGGLAANYLPLLAWTWYASTVAWYQALENDDPALGTKALLG